MAFDFQEEYKKRMKELEEQRKNLQTEADGTVPAQQIETNYKEEYPDLARAYAEMAEQELTHANKLHEFVVKFIAKVRETVEPPKWMLEMWEEEHKEIIEDVAKAKAMIAMIQR